MYINLMYGYGWKVYVFIIFFIFAGLFSFTIIQYTDLMVFLIQLIQPNVPQ